MSRLDWDQVKRRLEAARAALEAGPGPERRARVYRERARVLARRRAPGPVLQGEEVLPLILGDQRYALELAALAEILPFQGCTPVPGAAREILGVLNARGEIRPLASLARLLGLPGEDPSAGGYVVFLRGSPVGLRVDGAEPLRRVARADWREAEVPGLVAGWLPQEPPRPPLQRLSAPALLSHPILSAQRGNR